MHKPRVLLWSRLPQTTTTYSSQNCTSDSSGSVDTRVTLYYVFVHTCTTISYLDVAGLLHEPSGVLCSSVSFGELDSEELESPLEVCLQQVLFRRLEGDEEEREQQGMINESQTS